jgi:hypothetical protein
MAIKSIEKIKIGNYPYGKFADGYIYSAEINQGYAENSNNLTIDLIREPNKTIILPEKNLTTSYRIQFGDLIFPVNYFIKHTKNIGVNEEVITCTFVDNSIILDKYFVGLSNRHYRVNESNQNFNIAVTCANCDNSISVQNGVVNRSVVAVSPNLVVNNLIVVGEEEFIDQACDVPDVKYNFSDLLAAMRKIPNFSFTNFSDINPEYRTSYTGTLREVLSNWCSDFGFSFYWDSLNNTLVCIDLRTPVNLNPIENFITSNFDKNNPNSNVPLSSFSEEETLEGTYQQDNIDYVLKPARTKEKSILEFFPITYSAIYPNDSFSDLDLALAKTNREAFTLYLLSRNRFSEIGFNMRYVGIETFVLETVLQSIYDFNLDGRAAIRIGAYNRDQGEAYAERVSAAAEDLGKYYVNLNYVKWNPLLCNDNSKYNVSITYDPQPLLGINPWRAYGGNPALPVGETWLIQRNPVWNINSNNFTVEGLGPIYVDITGEIADQVRDALLLINKNDVNADRYRNLTLIAYKPLLSIQTNFNYFNSAEESFMPAVLTQNQINECQTICEKDSNSEICRQTCNNITAPANGLVSKISKLYTITNSLNNSSASIGLPSQQNYLGYTKAEGSFSYVEPGIKQMQGNTNFQANPNVMNYNVNLNDVTTNEPSVGQTINFSTIDQNSDNLDIIQTNKKKSLSLKIIGMNYGDLNQYLNPTYGLTNFSIYLNDNGVFSDLTFQNRPEKRPDQEVVMQKVGPRKTIIRK